MDWATLFSTFGLLFVAEFGDKTQLAIISQTCKFRRPLPIFLGGSLALVAVTALGVIFGRLLNSLIPVLLIRRVAAGLFILMGLLILREWRRQRGASPASEPDAAECTPEEGRRINWRAFATTLVPIFVAELGDKSQLATLSLASEASSPWPVAIGASSALVLVTALGVLFGHGLSRLIPERILRLLAALAFIALGVVMGAGLI